MVGRRRKILKILHWLKCPKTVPKKTNLDQKINDYKPHIWSLSINFGFSSRKSQTQQKLAKNLTHFTNINPLNITKYLLPQHRQKYVSCWCQNIFTAPFLETQELHSPSTWKVNVCIFTRFFQGCRKFLSGRGLNNFLQGA